MKNKVFSNYMIKK